MGARVLINDGWYKSKAEKIPQLHCQFFFQTQPNGRINRNPGIVAMVGSISHNSPAPTGVTS